MENKCQNNADLQFMKVVEFKSYAEQFEIKCKGYVYQFKRFLTLKGYFQNLLRHNGIDGIIRTVCIRNIDNPNTEHYDYILAQHEGTFLMLGISESTKYYQVKNILYTKISGLHVDVKEITKEEWGRV